MNNTIISNLVWPEVVLVKLAGDRWILHNCEMPVGEELVWPERYQIHPDFWSAVQTFEMLRAHGAKWRTAKSRRLDAMLPAVREWAASEFEALPQ